MDAAKLQGMLRSTSRVSAIAYREMFLPEAAKGNDNTLWSTYASGVLTLSHAWCMTDHSPPKPTQLLELEIRDQWVLFILVAKSIDAHHPAQDRLTRLIMWTKEMGVLSRTLKSTGSSGSKGSDNIVVETASTAEHGRIWTDLPFFLPDVQAAWKQAIVLLPTSSTAECANLTAAIARLAGIGLLDDAFSGCGLEIMRLVLETPYSLVDAEANGPGPTQVLRFLPLVRLWLHFAGWKLLQLSVANHADNHSAWCTSDERSTSSIGLLAREVGISTEGCSQARFAFWLQRLAELKTSHIDCDDAAKSWSQIVYLWNVRFGIRGISVSA